jgi:TolA-binding protein
MKAVHPCAVAAAIFLLPAAAFAQRSGDPAYIEGRLNGLRQQLADLSARIKQLEVQDQQLHERLERMRTNFEARLGQQENGARRRGDFQIRARAC